MNGSYPVRVDATLDTGLSRWLWLVKWLLAIPHYIVLAFLWLAFVVLSVVAFVAILVTGRYPRAIFDFNVGVLRWSWRVAYYAYAAFGTDRYPPFTLAERPDYPAHLTVDYPEQLSRGLVLVKWWLLAIPHYLVVALLAGSGVYLAFGTDEGRPLVWGTGLIGLLALFAAVALLFTGRYPQQLFDLVLGLNRWVLRVAAYAGLMTDEYPPFRLDLGGTDPATSRVAVPAEPAAPPSQVTWGPGRVVAVVLGSLVFLVSGGLLTAGATLGVADATLRNDDGYLMTGSTSLRTSSYAIASEPFVIASGTDGEPLPKAVLGDVVIRTDANEPVFVGIAPAADVAAYLEGVEHVRLVDLESPGGLGRTVYREQPGGAVRTLPGDTDIWAATATGSGVQELTWEPTDGRWAVVMMSPQGDAGVSSQVSIGATLPVLGWVVAALLVAGGLLLLVAIGLVLGALHGSPRTERATSAATAPPEQGSTERGEQ